MQRCPLSQPPFNIILEVLGNAIGLEKKMKSLQIEKEDIKLFLFTDDINSYVENQRINKKIPWNL